MRELSIFVNEGIESLRNDGAAKNQKGNIIVQLQLFIRIQIFFFDSLKTILSVNVNEVKCDQLRMDFFFTPIQCDYTTL